MRQQIGHDLEGFASQSAHTPGAVQLSALRVESPLAEDVQHGGQPPPCASWLTPTSTCRCDDDSRCMRSCPHVCPQRASTARGVYTWRGNKYTTEVDCRKIPGL